MTHNVFDQNPADPPKDTDPQPNFLEVIDAAMNRKPGSLSARYVFDQNPTDPPKDENATRLAVALVSYVDDGVKDPRPKLWAMLDAAMDRKQIASYRYLGFERQRGPVLVRYEFGFDARTPLTIGELFETAKNIAQDITQQDSVIHNVQIH